jgi:hypothetical protein
MDGAFIYFDASASALRLHRPARAFINCWSAAAAFLLACGALTAHGCAQVTLSNSSIQIPVEASLQDDGRVLCSYAAAVPGFYRLEVCSRGVHLKGSPFSVLVRPPVSCYLLLMPPHLIMHTPIVLT